MFRMLAVVAATLGSLAATQAQAAQAESWFVRGGVTRLELADEIELTAGGAPVPGADIETEAHFTPTIQVGRFIGRHFAAALTVGLPPHIAIEGAGALEPFGRLAETTYGPATLMLQFRPISEGAFQPYVGAGAAYMIVFDEDEGAFQDVEIDNDLAPAIEAGVDIMFTPRIGMFLEAKRAYLRTQTRGSFGGAPVVGEVRLDPWALSGGVVVRF